MQARSSMYQLNGLHQLPSWCKLDPTCIRCPADASLVQHVSVVQLILDLTCIYLSGMYPLSSWCKLDLACISYTAHEVSRECRHWHHIALVIKAGEPWRLLGTRSKWDGLAWRQGVRLVNRGTSVRICFGSPFSALKVVVCGHCLVTPSLTINEILKWLSWLPILMQKSFWWWRCSDRYIFFPLPPPPYHLPSFSPSLISLTVSVDVKHHVYLLMKKGASFDGLQATLPSWLETAS